MKNRASIVEDIINETTTNIPQITNYRAGGVFRLFVEVIATFLEKIYSELEVLLPQRFIHTSSGSWLDLKAEELSLYRYGATRTKGYVYFTRTDSEKTITIAKDKVVATAQGLRYKVIDDTIMDSSVKSKSVLVQAEELGSRYNVSIGQITEFITPISGVDSVGNIGSWIIEMGTDEETDEELRARCMLLWSSANGSNVDAYVNWAKSVDGVGDVQVMPTYRGAGTVNIYCIGINNTLATYALIKKVYDVIDANRPVATSVVVLAAVPAAAPVDVTVVVSSTHTVTREQIQESIQLYFNSLRIAEDVEPSALISYIFMNEGVKSVTVNSPQKVPMTTGSFAYLSSTPVINIQTDTES